MSGMTDQELANEYRPSMTLDVLHSWASEAAARLRGDGEQGRTVAGWKEHCDAAFEDYFEADRDDPSVRPDIELWRQSWLRALSTQPAPSEQVAASVAVPVHGDDAGDGLRYVTCQFGAGDHYRDFLLIPHVDGQYVTAAKLQPFGAAILRTQLAKHDAAAPVAP